MRYRVIYLVNRVTFDGLGQTRQQIGHLARDAGVDARRVQAVRVKPDLAQALADVVFGEVLKTDAVTARVRKRRVGGTALAEFGIHLNDRADIDHQHKRRAALGGWQGTGIAFGLTAGAQQAVVKTLGVAGGLELLGLKAKRALAVAVNAPGAAGAVAVAKGHRTLEHVILLGRGVRLVHAQQSAQIDDKALRRGKFTCSHAPPAGDKTVGSIVG